MRREDELINYAKQKLGMPNLHLSKRINTFYSTILVLDTGQNSNPQKIIAKYCRLSMPGEVKEEYNNILRFHECNKGTLISCPRPIGFDDGRKILFMEYVEGKNLKGFLLNLRPSKEFFLRESADLAALGLSQYHKISTCERSDPLDYDSSYFGKDIHFAIEEDRIKDRNLDFLVNPFLDYGVWNILISKNPESRESKAIIIDFPTRHFTFLPHIDLARMRFSLRILKLHPQFRLLGLSWWDINEFYDTFIERYCQEIAIDMNATDRRIVDWLDGLYLQRILSIYAHERYRARLLLEGAYMSKPLRKAIASMMESDIR